MAANTVLPVMFGNSARIVSHTIPAYEPALCPRMCSELTIYLANFTDSVGVWEQADSNQRVRNQ